MKKNAIRADIDENSNLNLMRYFNLFINNIKFICFVAITVSLIAFVVSYMLPKKYMASSSIAVEENIISDLVQGIAITSSAESKIRLLQVELLSRDILSEVATILELDLHVSNSEQKEALITALKENTSINHDSRRNVFYVTFIDSKPVVARDFVNTLIRIYIDNSTAEKRQDSFDATAFLSEQIEIFQDRIDKAQVAIDKFKAEEGIYLSLNESMLQQKITTLNQNLESMRIEKNKLLSERHLLSDLSQLTESLREKEAELQSAKSVYTEKHPNYKRLIAEVDNLKLRIEEASKNPELESENSEYQVIQIELTSLEETEESLIKERDENLKNLELLPTIKTRLAELEQAKANELIIYQQLVGRLGQSEVSKQMELQDKAVSFRVIDAAITPTTFISPVRYLIMIGGIMAGFALGFGIIIAKSFLRPQIHSAEELALYSVPVLVKLPVVIQPEVLKKRNRINWIVVIATFCILGFIFITAVLEFFEVSIVEKLLSF